MCGTMCQPVIFLCIILQVHNSVAGPLWNKYEHYLGLNSVDIFRKYVRIDTSTPDSIKDAVDFLIRQVTKIGIPYTIYKPAGKPIFVATVQGRDPSLPSIMLNSHIDVVKADPNEWQYPPFDAYMDANGNIYGRGTQDTKDVGIQYLEAIRKLKNDNATFLRTVHLTYMPDEETGGKNGMKVFTTTEDFKSLNIGFALDEGIFNTEDVLHATFVDRRAWQMKFVINGKGGHGYTMPDDSAMEKTYKFIHAVMDYRRTQKDLLSKKDSADFTSIADVTSLNINIINGGLAENIIPSQLTLVVDMRLATHADPAEMDSIVQSWMAATGNTTEISYIRKETESGLTSVDATNPYWITMKNTLKDMGIKVKPIVCPATSDMLVIRNLGIPAIGFTTKRKTEPRLHGKNEYQHVETFLKGIDIYTELIKSLANLPAR